MAKIFDGGRHLHDIPDEAASGGDRSTAGGEGKPSEAAGAAGEARRQADDGPDLDSDRYHRFDADETRDVRRRQRERDAEAAADARPPGDEGG